MTTLRIRHCNFRNSVVLKSGPLFYLWPSNSVCIWENIGFALIILECWPRPRATELIVGFQAPCRAESSRSQLLTLMISFRPCPVSVHLPSCSHLIYTVGDTEALPAAAGHIPLLTSDDPDRERKHEAG